MAKIRVGFNLKIDLLNLAPSYWATKNFNRKTPGAILFSVVF